MFSGTAKRVSAEVLQVPLALAPSIHARIKGTGLAVVAPYVRARWGTEGVAKLQGRVRSQPSIDVLAGRVLFGSWYSFGTMIELLDTGEALFGSGFSRDLGRFGAARDLRGVYRAFLRLASPGFLIERAGTVWRQYYSSGEMCVTRSSNSAVVELRGFSRPHGNHCETIVGWSARGMELSGARDVRGEHTSCRSRGNPHCLFEYKWT